MAAVRAGVWLRPFRDLIYTMPPYISSAQDISAIGAGITAAIASYPGWRLRTDAMRNRGQTSTGLPISLSR